MYWQRLRDNTYWNRVHVPEDERSQYWGDKFVPCTKAEFDKAASIYSAAKRREQMEKASELSESRRPQIVGPSTGAGPSGSRRTPVVGDTKWREQPGPNRSGGTPGGGRGTDPSGSGWRPGGSRGTGPSGSGGTPRGGRGTGPSGSGRRPGDSRGTGPSGSGGRLVVGGTKWREQ